MSDQRIGVVGAVFLASCKSILAAESILRT